MKHLLSFCCVVFALSGWSQFHADSLFRKVVDSRYKGGIEAFENYVATTSQIKEKDMEDTRNRGTVVLTFVLTVEGKIDEIQTINSVCAKMDEDAYTLLKNSERNWIVRKEDDKSVATSIEVSFHYKPFERAELKPMKEKIPGLYEKKDYNEIHHILDAVIRNQPYDKEAFFGRGFLFQEQGETEKACQSWKRATVLGDIDSESMLQRYCQ